jgi:sugar phosphate isomerase/epimerase
LAPSSSLATAAYAWRSSAAATEKNIPIGVQLWTLRKEPADDLAGTLRQVAAIGHQGVELLFQKWPTAVELKKIVADCGLDLASAHVNLKDLLDDFPRLVDYHRTVIRFNRGAEN